MAASNEPVLQTCTACAALIDVTKEEPFGLMHCPACGEVQRVRRNFHSYELQEVLGAGGMGAVYRALDKNLTRFVALKLLRPEFSNDAEFVLQLQKEAAITASINHPNVVKVYTAGQDHGLVYIAMELVDKGSLDELMTLQGRVAESQVLEVGIHIARGLNAALQRGLIHRDVKPGNILFADAHTAKIVDFGLAVAQDQAGTVAGEVWGTPYYVAPEKLDNQPEDFRSDLYSLGATLFHAFAGRPPFEAETASMITLKHLKSQLVSLQAFAPDVSSATAYVINKALAKEPKDRYQSYEDFIEHLEYARSELLSKSAGINRRQPRALLTGEAGAKAMSWVTSTMVALVLLGAAAIYSQRESFFPGNLAPGADVPRPGDPKANAQVEPRFKAARAHLLERRWKEAATSFAKLGNEPNLPQPLLNWVNLHQGLTQLLAGDEERSREFFERIEARGPYSNDPAEKKLAQFFVDLSRQLTGSQTAAPSVARNYEKTSHESIALLLLALKDWRLGKFEDGGALFRQFHSSSPQPPYAWIGDYKDLTEPYLAELGIFHSAKDAIKTARTLEKQKEALELGQAAQATLTTAHPLTKTLTPLLAELEEKIQAVEIAETQKVTAQTEADSKLLGPLHRQFDLLCQQLKFPEARQAALAVQPTGEAGKREQAGLVKKAEWLGRFKTILINDINTTGYPQPIARKNGQPIPGTATRANDLGMEVRSPYGSAPVAWSDLSLETILQIGRSFIRPTMAPEIAADRRWFCGVFAFLAGKDREGRELLIEAAQHKPLYDHELPLFLEASGSQ